MTLLSPLMVMTALLVTGVVLGGCFGPRGSENDVGGCGIPVGTVEHLDDPTLSTETMESSAPSVLELVPTNASGVIIPCDEVRSLREVIEERTGTRCASAYFEDEGQFFRIRAC